VLVLFISGCLDWESLYGPRESPSCGDGRTSGDEECDDGNTSDDDACVEGCRAARCGDGFVWLGNEECDDENRQDGDGCSSACRLEVDRCGDGTREPPEECDDGNRVPGDGCSGTCTIEPPVALCGNGTLDPGEACDDGNRDNTDSCLNGCSVAACGDGFVRNGVEECDDGNHDNGDGCSSVCLACDTGDAVFFRTANGHCYTSISKAAGFFGATNTCDASGGFLWTTTSQSEAKDVSKVLLGALPPVWLGFRSDTTPPQWITGESTQYQSWDAGQPVGPPNGCALQRVDGTNPPLWFTAPCTEAHPYVCEREPPLILANHHAYRLRTGLKTWDAAKAECERSGGHLVAIETEDEQTQLARHLSVEIWLGAHRDSSGDFAWVTGPKVTFTAFASGEPNGSPGTIDCLAFSRADAWLDADCAQQKRYLCEYE
jgi:cysteine-rich repeat protein